MGKLQEALRVAKRNAYDGFNPESPIIVKRESWDEIVRIVRER